MVDNLFPITILNYQCYKLWSWLICRKRTLVIVDQNKKHQIHYEQPAHYQGGSATFHFKKSLDWVIWFWLVNPERGDTHSDRDHPLSVEIIRITVNNKGWTIRCIQLGVRSNQSVIVWKVRLDSSRLLIPPVKWTKKRRQMGWKAGPVRYVIEIGNYGNCYQQAGVQANHSDIYSSWSFPNPTTFIIYIKKYIPYVLTG